MCKKVLMVVFLITSLLLLGCSAQIEPLPQGEQTKMEDIGKADGNSPTPTQNIATPQKVVDPDPIRQIVDTLTLDQKIGQIMMVGFDGTTFSEHASDMIEKYHIGGFILFKRNLTSVKQSVTLVNAIKAANRPKPFPLLISVDEEGGRITRIPNVITQTPTAERIGKQKDTTYAENIGKVIGLKLDAFGFNMDFAPVLDINSNPDNPIIGDRSFGAKEDIVSDTGIAVMKGLQDQDIIPVIKHFPGHGDTSVDSHLGLPEVEHDLKRLKEFELIPFQKAIDEGADAVLVAHILFPQIDKDNPATFSKAIVTDLLREDMGFKGVVITDDMEMGAIAKNYKIGDAAVRAFKAGNDILLICHTLEKQITAMEAIKKAVQSGDIPMEQLDESVYRILKLKKKYGLTDKPIDAVSVSKLNEEIQSILRK